MFLSPRAYLSEFRPADGKHQHLVFSLISSPLCDLQSKLQAAVFILTVPGHGFSTKTFIPMMDVSKQRGPLSFYCSYIFSFFEFYSDFNLLFILKSTVFKCVV